MPKPAEHLATPSNSGLRALEQALAGARRRRAGLAADGAAPPADLIAATDGIGIAFLDGLSRANEDALKERIKAILPGWELRPESIDLPIERFHGVTALPPYDQTPPIAEAWELARLIAGIEGVKSAVPLFAQLSPDADLQAESAARLGTGEDDMADRMPRPDWHLRVLKVREAWQNLPPETGGPGHGVTVAVLDTGYTDHPEIFERLTKEPGDPSQVRGLDLLDGQDPRDPLLGGPPITFPSHGTAVTSVIVSPVAPPPTEDFVTGIAPAAEVMPVRVSTNVVHLLPNKLTPAIRDAVNAGADVINMSLGMPTYWPALHAAIRYAVNQGVIVVAASGNYWPVVVYPARYPEVLAVAACNAQRQPWFWASAGEAVDVIAPGVDVQRAYSELGDHAEVDFKTGPSTGTTYASACCSGLAALWLARHGGRRNLIDHYGGDARRVSQAFHYLIRNTAEQLPEARVELYGEGLPQADKLLNAPLPTPQVLDRDAQEIRLQVAALDEAGGAALLGLALEDSAHGEMAAQWRELLGAQTAELSLEGLLSEVSFNLVSRPGLWQVFLAGRVNEVRTALLESETISTALRQQLEAADPARARLVVAPAAVTPPAFRTRMAPDPARRLLHVYAFDPSLGTSLRTMDYNKVAIGVPWERLRPGPVGEYLEVVDVDPASSYAYEPVDLDDARLLANDGLDPDEGNPWFHQQMVYAVAMKTIGHFETALGRPAMWAVGRRKEGKEREPFYQRLRIYPHALRERNAYYSPEKRALLFGYFRSPGPGGAPTGPMVFTCLSYDIIAHEATHALLDGMYRYYIEDTNLDMLAFHEAFADIVALFQHFTHPEVLRAAIGETRGDLEADSLLGKLAQQFGDATGHRGALRDAIGETKDGKWHRRQPDPSLLDRREYRASPHLRGSILVAALFDAFLKIYQRRARPVIRLATHGSEVLPPGNIPVDLAEALAREAAKTAGQVLNLCIRALDYLPPIDITFGEFLRAAITADRDLVPNDPLGYRVALVESFRAWGIQPEGVTTVAPESLSWSRPESFAAQFCLSEPLLDQLNRMLPAWRVNRSRRALHLATVQAKIRCNLELKDSQNRLLGPEIGIDLARPFEVHTLRPATTVGPDGNINPTVVMTLLQKKEQMGRPMIRTGSTLLFSRGDGKIRYAIHKRDTRGTRAEETQQHASFRLAHAAESDPYRIASHEAEPFAALHLTGSP